MAEYCFHTTTLALLLKSEKLKYPYLISFGQQKKRVRRMAVVMMAAVAEGIKRGAKDTRAVIPGKRQKSQGK